MAYSPQNIYAPLIEIRSYLSLASGNTTDDEQLLKYLYRASRTIDKYTHRRFYPEQRPTQYFDLPKGNYELRTRGELLEVIGLSAVNGASAVDSSVYWLRCGDDWNMTPYDRIVLDDSSGSLFNYAGTPQRAIHLDAFWGYHEHYDRANEGWVNSGLTLSASMSTGVTVASLSGSSDITNVIGEQPALFGEQLLRINNEFLHITGASGATSLISVLRGVNGTTTASHASGVALQTWQPEPDISFSTTRLAAWQYQQAMAPFTHKVRMIGMGTLELPETWPPDVLDKLERYRKQRID